jgi:glycoside/pentoside/hexuronide:cation symporter, GPH family
LSSLLGASPNPMSDPSQKLTVREKMGYSIGDVGTNFIFMSMILYQGRFYTDTMGISAVAVGWMFILVRGADAVFDPIVGALSDRTESRWGKFRPWLLWTSLPLGVIFWLSYLTPHFGPGGKLAYACVTYVLLMMLYSANNTPYSALNGVMTADASERTSASTYRFIAAMIGQFVIQALALPLVDKLGRGDDARGWALTMGVFAALMVVFYLVAFANTRERVAPDPRQKNSVRSDLVDIFSCRPWVMMFLLTLFLFTALAMRGSSMNYYFAYYVSKSRLAAFLGSVGLGASGGSSWWTRGLGTIGLIVRPDGGNVVSVGLSFFLMSANLVQIPGILASRALSDRFGKKTVFIAGLSLATLAAALIVVVPPESIALLFGLCMLWPLAWGPTIPLLWVMIADVADYSEWKNSRRATGFVYAGIIFALKAGLGFGGALGGWLLAASGYVPNVAQSARALQGIRLCMTIFSALPFALGVLCLVLYPIGKELNLRLQTELAERRRSLSGA